MFGEAYAYHEPDLQTRPELYGKYTRQQLRQGALYSAADYVQAQRVRSLIKAGNDCRRSPTVDVLITPTMLGVAPTFEGYDPTSLSRSRPSLAHLEPDRLAGAEHLLWLLRGRSADRACRSSASRSTSRRCSKLGDAYQPITDWHLAVPEPVEAAQLMTTVHRRRPIRGSSARRPPKPLTLFWRWRACR